MAKLAKTAARGYGSRHQRLRAEYQWLMDHGEPYNCWRCRRPILPGQPWDLGHDDYDRNLYRGPEHRYARHCPAGGNRRAGLMKAIGRQAAVRRWRL